jgi:hypothetical protein
VFGRRSVRDPYGLHFLRVKGRISPVGGGRNHQTLSGESLPPDYGNAPKEVSFGQRVALMRIFRPKTYPNAIRRATICLMTSSCAVRRRLTEKFALATRQYAESAVGLAISGKSGMDFARLRDQTIKRGRSEVAFRAFTEHVIRGEHSQ